MAGKKSTNANATQTTTAKVPNLYAAMRPALVAAHNDGNTKAINDQRISDLGIDTTAFNMWKSEVKLIHNECKAYVTLKKNGRFDSTITAEQIAEARERIYPLWKKLLGFGEKSKYEKELKCQESDVEDLIGFAWEFFNTGKGTAEVCTKDSVFRKKVESLLGCVIARNEVLSADDREILNRYQRAIRKQAQAKDTIAELEKKIETFNTTLAGIGESEAMEPFRAYVQKQIKSVQDDIDAAKAKQFDAEAEEKKTKEKAQELQNKMRAAK